MDINQYKSLCDVCDDAINKRKSLCRVSIPYLHIMREHPVTLKRYSGIFSDNSNSNVAPSLQKKSLTFEKIRNYIKTFCYFGQSISRDLDIFKDIDVVIISHLININHLQSSNDFYFQNLSEYLDDSNINYLFLLIDHTDNPIKNNSSIIDSRIILPKKLGLIGEISITLRMIKEFVIMKITSLNEKGLLKKVLKNSSSFKEIGSSLFALRVGKQFEEVIKFYKPKAILTTYEGHSWERVLFNIANRYDNDLLRVAYQHTVVTKRAHAITRSLGKGYDPDIIFTSGNITNLIFKKILKNTHIKVKTLGSKKKLNNLTSHKNKKEICLVLPEGLVEECDKLFRFSIKCARLMPKIDFIWRLHPVISFNDVFSYMGVTKSDLPNNIIISKSSINDDILNSKFALYRGTTAIVEAIYGEVIPIYLAEDGELTIDLLYEFDSKHRKIIYSVDDFIKVANSDNLQFHTSLIDYCNRYFMPFNFTYFSNVLKDNTSIK